MESELVLSWGKTMVKTPMAGANRGNVMEESTDTSPMPSTIAPTVVTPENTPLQTTTKKLNGKDFLQWSRAILMAIWGWKTGLPRWHDLKTSKDRSFIHNLVCKQQYCHVMACELHEWWYPKQLPVLSNRKKKNLGLIESLLFRLREFCPIFWVKKYDTKLKLRSYRRRHLFYLSFKVVARTRPSRWLSMDMYRRLRKV